MLIKILKSTAVMAGFSLILFGVTAFVFACPAAVYARPSLLSPHSIQTGLPEANVVSKLVAVTEHSFVLTKPLQINLNNVKPGYAESHAKSGGTAMFLLLSSANSLSSPTSYYSEPTIVAETALLKVVTLPGYGRTIRTCGYDKGETLTVSLFNPVGQPILEEEVKVTPVPDTETGITFDYCAQIDQVAKFAFMPDATLGTYTVQLAGSRTTLLHTFDLRPLTGPVVYYVDWAQSYVLAGFKPAEEVQVLVYQKEIFLGQTTLKLDNVGVAVLTDPDPELAVYVLRQNFAMVTNKPQEDVQIFNYTNLTALYPANANVYYQQGLHHPSGQDQIPDFNTAIKLDPNLAAAYTGRGEVYRGQGQFNQALADLNRALELNPFLLSAYETRALIYTQQNNYNAAIADYSKIIDSRASDPNLDPMIYFNRARLYIATGNADQALADFIKGMELEGRGKSYQIDSYTQALALDPTLTLAYLRRAEAGSGQQALNDYYRAAELDPGYLPRFYAARARFYEEQNNYVAAISDYTQLIELEPDNILAHLRRVELYKNLGDDNAVIAGYSHLVERFPRYLPAYYHRGRVFEQLGNANQAAIDYTSLIRRDPDGSPLPYYARAHLYNRYDYTDLAGADLIKAVELEVAFGGKYGAPEDYDQAVKLNPKAALAYYRRGVVLSSSQANYNPALADFDTVITLDPVYLPAYEARAAVYEALNRYPEALADYTTLITLRNPDSYTSLPYFRRARLYQQQGQYDLAIADYSEIIRHDPTDSAAYQARAELYKAQGRDEEAIADLSKVIESNPAWPSLYYERAHLYEGQDRVDEALNDYIMAIELDEYGGAINDYSRVIELNPNFALAYFRRGRAYYFEGSKALAMADFERVLSLTSDPSLREQAEEQLRNLR